MPSAPRGFYGALFLVSMSALLWETLLTRIFSVILHYHFAFMAVSLAMFGLTVGAVWALVAEDGREELAARLSRLALSSGLLMAAAIALQLALPIRFVLPEVPSGYLVATYALCALPLIPAGAFITLALARISPASKVYACDLAGAACASLALPLLLGALGGPGAAVAAGATGCLGGWLLSRRRPAALICALLLAAFSMANARGNWLRVRWSGGGSAPAPLYERWNAFSRVVVLPVPLGPPFSWAMEPGLLRRQAPVEQRMLAIDSGAATPITRYDGDLRSLRHLRYDLTSFAHWLRHPADTLVIGAGGGRDILTALSFGSPSVTAVEVNPAVLDAVHRAFGDFSGHLDRLPQVRVIQAEGRQFLERDPRRYDIIQLSLVDTAAATASGAYALVENGLYTVEAWELFLRRLKPGGLLAVARAGSEMPRAAVLAGAALRGLGVADPSRHILLARVPGSIVETILVSPDVLSEADLANAKKVCLELRCQAEPVSADTGLSALAAGASPEELALLPFDASAPTDDRPFFFYNVKSGELLRGGPAPIIGALRTLIFWTLALALGLTVLPAAALARQGRWRAAAGKSPAGLPLYFALIGLAFMFVEIGLMQRLSLFLGHPTLGFTVALFSLLLCGGAGSFLSERFANGPRSLAALTLVLAAAVPASRLLAASGMGWPTPLRIVLSVLMIAPPALLMGTAFPAGMRLIRAFDDQRTAWHWAINGAASVVGSVLAMVCSLSIGISGTLWLGVALYAAATALCARLSAAD